MRLRRRVHPVAAVALLAIAIAAILIARALASPDHHFRALHAPLHVADRAAAHSKWLRAAETAYDHARAWWDPQRGWYLKYLPGSRNHAHRLVTLWHVVHLFDATSAIAIADPAHAHIAAARAFANTAERYWDPAIRPVPGYGPAPDDPNPNARIWYDDDAWWGYAFMDAYTATHDARYMRDAERALAFVNSGWDPAGGGIFWDIHKTFKSSESLAGATLTAAMLYQQTHDARYLHMAQRNIAWADRTIRGGDGLYGARSTPARPMPYVQGPMAEAMLRLCHASGQRSWCAKGERLMQAMAKRWPALAMGPPYDAIYIRSVLEVYRMDHNPRWYALAQNVGNEILHNATLPNGLLLKTWQGRLFRQAGEPPGRLQLHAASTSVLAWLAAIPRR
jgi:hypothetical protein